VGEEPFHYAFTCIECLNVGLRRRIFLRRLLGSLLTRGLGLGVESYPARRTAVRLMAILASPLCEERQRAAYERQSRPPLTGNGTLSSTVSMCGKFAAAASARCVIGGSAAAASTGHMTAATPPQVGHGAGLSTGGSPSLGWVRPGLRTERRSQDDTPKGKMVRALLPRS
jgi:hypothetical protein